MINGNSENTVPADGAIIEAIAGAGPSIASYIYNNITWDNFLSTQSFSEYTEEIKSNFKEIFSNHLKNFEYKTDQEVQAELDRIIPFLNSAIWTFLNEHKGQFA